MRHKALTRRAWRYGLIGLLATGAHVGIAVTMISWVHPSPVLANGVAFTCATALSYLFNTQWSFSASLQGGNLLRYLVVVGIGFGVTVAVSGLAASLGWHYLIGIAMVVCLVPLVSFGLHHFWTYG